MKISIVTVCYNAENCIEKTIASVINQDFKDFEYIIIDGKSTDNTLSIIDKYRSRINHFVSEKDYGIYDAMNKGIDMATGEWINFMNAGDTFADDHVLSSFFRSYNGLSDVVFGDEIMTGSGEPFLRKGKLYSYKFPDLGHQSTFVRTSLMKKYHYNLDYRISADFEFLYRLYKEGYKFQYIDFPISCYDISGLSSSNRYQLYIEHCKIQESKPRFCKLIKYRLEDLMPMTLIHSLHIHKKRLKKLRFLYGNK